MPQLMAIAEYVSKVHAICVHCGNLAHDFVQCLIKENALLDGTYVEPYVGGGSVA